MREATAGKAAKTVVADAGPTAGEQHADNPPASQTRFATVLMARSKTARVLLTSSPPFRILMTGSSISMFGSRISTIAFPLLVLHLNHSPLIAGLVTFAAIAPSMLAYLPAGVLVDRWNPRRVMLVSELLRGITIATVVISLVVFGQRLNIWFLILAMVVEEILEIFSMLAERRYLSGLTERENIASRQAYIEVRTHAAILAGRPVGPFLFAIQPVLPFLADAISFLFSIGSILLLRSRDEPVREAQPLPPRQLLVDIGKGFGWLTNDRRARLTVLLMAVTSLVAQALILMLLTEAHAKELSTVAIGVVLAASGAGGAVGSVFSRFLPDKIRRFWLPVQMSAWSVAIAFLAVAGGLPASASAFAMFILGLTGAIGNIEFGTYLVSEVAEEMIARVTAIGQLLTIGACAVGPVLGGAAIQHYGVQGAVQILLVIVVLLSFFSLFTPEVAQRMAKIHRSTRRALPRAQPATVPSRQLAAGRRWGAGDGNSADLPADAPIPEVRASPWASNRRP